MGDWVDKGLVRSCEGFDSGPGLVVDGIQEVRKGAMVDEVRRGWRWVTRWLRSGMRRERVFVGKEELH